VRSTCSKKIRFAAIWCGPIRSSIAKLIAFAVFSTAIFPIAASSEESAVFRTSDKTSYSKYLGFEAVPAYVLIGNQRHAGLYVVTRPTSGLGREMELAAGSLLLTVDGYTMSTPAVADSWLAHRPQKPLNFTWATVRSGKWVIGGGLVAKPGSVAPSADPPASSGTASGNQQEKSIDELERLMVDQINASRRTEGGLSSLQTDPGLSALARKYAQYMMDHRALYELPVPKFTHVDPDGRAPMDRARASGINIEVHENIGIDNRLQGNDTFLLERQEQIMMREPRDGHTHHAIICDPEARIVGVGVARSKLRLYLVEEFGH
jgi:uncharacterized protein YkwD